MMPSDTNALLPVQSIPAFDDPGRVQRSAVYICKMAVAANSGLLAANALHKLQASSGTVLGMGLPDLVLLRGPDGVWYVHDRGVEPVNTGPVNSPDVNTGPVNTGWAVNTDRKAYMREYMRAKRAKERGE